VLFFIKKYFCGFLLIKNLHQMVGRVKSLRPWALALYGHIKNGFVFNLKIGSSWNMIFQYNCFFYKINKNKNKMLGL